MEYYFSKTIRGSFEDTVQKVKDKIGTMLPCNVIVQEKVTGQVEVSAVDPVASMLSVKNGDLREIPTQIRVKLQSVIAQLL